MIPCPPPAPVAGSPQTAIWDEVQFNQGQFDETPPLIVSACDPPTLPGPTFTDLVSELVGTVPRLSALHAQQLINRAWARIRDSRLWSFHFISDAQLFVPDAITTGTVSPVFNSTTVWVDAAAAGALNAVATGNPPLACPTLGIGRQIRIGSTNALSSPTGPNYSIVAWDGLSQLQIDRPFGETTVVNAPYQVLKCYYAPPAPPPFSNPQPDLRFVRYQVITNRNAGYAIFGPNLYWSQAQLNAIDPQRGGQGDAYIVANYGRNCWGQQVVELYPNPVKFTTYSATYWTRCRDLSPTARLPVVPYELPDLVMFGSKTLAADWATANVNTFPELQLTNWIAYRQTQSLEYRASMINCFKQDDEIMPLIPFRQGQGFMFPLGGQFLQSHDVTAVLPRGY
jgi:hypothetical protein